MSDEIFFDTNIIAYAFDRTEPSKRDVCASLIKKVVVGEITGVISNQVVGELFNFFSTRMRKPFPKNTALDLVAGFISSERWIKIDYSSNTVMGALDILEKRGGSIWDAIIVQTMKENGIKKIFTEEKFFEKVPGITVINPFRK